MSEYNSNNELIEAVTTGDLAVVNALITAGFNLNTQGDGGYTALHWAAQDGRLEIVRALITAGADASITDKYNRTPLQRAFWNEYTEVVDLLSTYERTGRIPELYNSNNANDATAPQVLEPSDQTTPVQEVIKGKGKK